MARPKNDAQTDARSDAQALLDAQLEGQPKRSQEFLRSISMQDIDREAQYRTADAYYRGDHRLQLTDRAKTYLENSGLPYNENFCETVCDVVAERLWVTGVSGDQDKVADWTWNELWDGDRVDRLQWQVHSAATRFGDAYVFIDFDDEHRQTRFTYNPPQQVRPFYEDRILKFVTKWWTTTEAGPLNPNGQIIVRLNIYLPDRVEKYYRLSKDEQGDWSTWVDGADEAWPTPWVYGPDNLPIGIPVIHFANRRKDTMFGVPEHWGSIPQQDRLNKELLDLSYVLDTMGWPQRYAIGVDSTTELKAVPGEVWRATSTDATFGQFEAASPDPVLRAIDATIQRLAGRSRTPLHLLGMERAYPSGEALKTAESGLIAKIRIRQLDHGASWEQMLSVGTKVALVFGIEAPMQLADEMPVLDLQWQDPQTRNELDYGDYLKTLRELGVSQHTVLTMIPNIDADDEMAQASADETSAAKRFGEFTRQQGQNQPPMGMPMVPAQRLNGGGV